MSTRGLQTMLALIVTDPSRKTALLHGSPTAYEGFDLSEQERQSLLAIKADALEDYAYQAHKLFYGEDLRATEGGQAAILVPCESYDENLSGRRQ